MAEDVKIFDGTNWKSLVGPEGPTAVSADAGNVAKLGTDGKVLVAQADLNAKYVEVAGDTMTGNLRVTATTTVTNPAGHIEAVGDGTSPVISVRRYQDGVSGGGVVRMFKARGTVAAPLPVQLNDITGLISWVGLNAAGAPIPTSSIFSQVLKAPATGENAIDGALILAVGDAATNNPAYQVVTIKAGATPGITTQNVSVSGILSVNSANPASEAALAKFVLVGTTGQSAGNLAETNTKALVSIRPNASSGYTLAIGATLPGNTPYLQGVNRTGGDSTAPFHINPYGGSVAIGTSTLSNYALDVAGITRVSTATGNAFTVTSTAGATNAAGVVIDMSGGTATNSVGLYMIGGPAATVARYTIYSTNPAQSYLQGNVGIGWSTPTNALEVAGTAKLRSTLEVVGNITSAGTAHSFAAGSIPSSAVIGSTAFTPATSAAAGTAGSMRWDENFLYIRTATAWKRVALTAF